MKLKRHDERAAGIGGSEKQAGNDPGAAAGKLAANNGPHDDARYAGLRHKEGKHADQHDIE